MNANMQVSTHSEMHEFGSKMYQNRCRPGLRPGPRWGSLRRSPRPPSRRLGACGPSLSRRLRHLDPTRPVLVRKRYGHLARNLRRSAGPVIKALSVHCRLPSMGRPNLPVVARKWSVYVGCLGHCIISSASVLPTWL